ncbi:MAG: helix-turn-helix domain-containing protein [Bacteroidales bacterium]|nr:helix-turn-helix domain-containing protein [Bacteroidales bacterium]
METIYKINHALSDIRNHLQRIEERLNVSSREVGGWLDHQDICKMLNISKRTLDHYRELGLIPFSKIGGKVFYRESDINAYLNNHITQKKLKKTGQRSAAVQETR